MVIFGVLSGQRSTLGNGLSGEPRSGQGVKGQLLDVAASIQVDCRHLFSGRGPGWGYTRKFHQGES